MQLFKTPEKSKTNTVVTANRNKQQPFFAPLYIQTEIGTGAFEASKEAVPESYWTGTIKGNLHENPSLYHTLNNFGDQQLRYMLRIKNQGHCLLSLETQYEYETKGLQRKWIAFSAQRGETREVINGLPPHSTLHLRLFGERDYTDADQTWCEGTIEVILQK